MQSPPVEHSTHTILVVDDAAVNRYSLHRVLRSGGFNTLECPSGSEALRQARTGVAAVVLDVNLPDVHGFEVCRLLRADPATANLPIVHISAVHIRDEDRLTGMSAGADAYYVSPVEPAVLIATLDALIRARGATQQVQESERVFRGAFENAGCGLAVIDAKGQVVETNAALGRLLRTSHRTLLRRQLVGLVPKGYVAQVQQAMAKWATQPWHGRFPLIDSAGERAMFEWKVTPHPIAGLCIALVIPSSESGTDFAPL